MQASSVPRPAPRSTLRGTHEQTQRQAAFLKAQLYGIAHTAIEQGWADAAAVRAAMADIDAWSKLPDAFYAVTWCEAVAWQGE